MRATILGTSLAIACFCLGAAVEARAGEFTARMTLESHGTHREGRLDVKGHRYRMSLKEQGRALLVIVDTDAGTTQIVVPDLKAYAEIPCDHPASLASDPFQGASHGVPGAAWHAVGTEAVADHECNKEVLRTAAGHDLTTRWVSSDLGFPLKIVTGPQSVVLSDIELRAVSDTCFALPAGCRAMPFEELGELLEQTTREGAAPEPITVNALAATGERWRVFVGEGTAVTVALSPFGMGAEWSAQPFRAGEPLLELAECTRSGEDSLSFAADLGADEIRVGVVAGDGSVKLVLTGAVPLQALAKQYALSAEYGKGGSLRRPYVTTRITVTGAADVGRQSAGSLGISRRLDSANHETEKVELLLESGETQTWAFAADQMVDALDVSMSQGAARIGLDQVFVDGFTLPVDARQPQATSETEPAPPAPPPPPTNVLAVGAGTSVLFATSQYNPDSWSATKNLIDGAVGRGHGWCASDASPQDVVFELPRPAAIQDVVVNVETVEGKSNWARDVEVWVSARSPYVGFEKAGDARLSDAPGDQRFAVRPLTGRYVQLRVLSNHGGSYIQLGEVSAMGVFVDEAPATPRRNVVATAEGGKLLSFTSQYNDSSWAARNAIDGQSGAGYEFASGSAQPCDLVFELGAEAEIIGIALNTATSEAASNWVKDAEVLVSTDAGDAGFTSVGRFEFANLVPLDRSRSPPDQEFDIAPTKARFVKLRLLSNHGGSYLELSEFKVFATIPAD